MKTELVTTLKRQATRLISKLQKDKLPILITEHGKPAAYLIDVQSFEMQQSRINILEGIALGERAIQEGRIMTREQAKRRMKKWLA